MVDAMKISSCATLEKFITVQRNNVQSWKIIWNKDQDQVYKGQALFALVMSILYSSFRKYMDLRRKEQQFYTVTLFNAQSISISFCLCWVWHCRLDQMHKKNSPRSFTFCIANTFPSILHPTNWCDIAFYVQKTPTLYIPIWIGHPPHPHPHTNCIWEGCIGIIPFHILLRFISLFLPNILNTILELPCNLSYRKQFISHASWYQYNRIQSISSYSQYQLM